MKKTIVSLILFSLFLHACTKDEIRIDPNNLLVGVWTYSDYKDNAEIYKRSSGFSDMHGYQFKSDGTLLERKITGWCGTPPVSYSNYDGTWTVLNDTLVQVKVGYWGGTMEYRLDIESVNQESLKMIQIPLNDLQ